MSKIFEQKSCWKAPPLVPETFLLRSPSFPMISHEWGSVLHPLHQASTTESHFGSPENAGFSSTMFNQWLASVQFSWFLVSALGIWYARNITSFFTPEVFKQFCRTCGRFVCLLHDLLLILLESTTNRSTNPTMEWYTVLVVIGMFVSPITEKR